MTGNSRNYKGKDVSNIVSYRQIAKMLERVIAFDQLLQREKGSPNPDQETEMSVRLSSRLRRHVERVAEEMEVDEGSLVVALIRTALGPRALQLYHIPETEELVNFKLLKSEKEDVDKNFPLPQFNPEF